MGVESNEREGEVRKGEVRNGIEQGVKEREGVEREYVKQGKITSQFCWNGMLVTKEQLVHTLNHAHNKGNKQGVGPATGSAPEHGLGLGQGQGLGLTSGQGQGQGQAPGLGSAAGSELGPEQRLAPASAPAPALGQTLGVGPGLAPGLGLDVNSPLLPTTYDLSSPCQLAAFVKETLDSGTHSSWGDGGDRRYNGDSGNGSSSSGSGSGSDSTTPKKHDLALDPVLWIMKRYRGRQSMDYPITSYLPCALRYAISNNSIA